MMTATYTRPPLTRELILQHLWAIAEDGWIETTVRQIARAIGRSAGQISVHLDALKTDGWIDKTSDHQSTLIEVLRSDSAHDRIQERSCTPDAPNSDHVVARKPDDLPHDRSRVLRNSHDSSSSSAERESDSAFPPDIPVVAPAIWGELCTGTPGYDATQFAADFRTMLARGYAPPNAVAIIITARSTGAPIYSSNQITQRAEQFRAAVAPPQEADHAPATRSDTRRGAAPERHAGAHQRRRSASPPSESNIPGWVDEFFGWPTHLIPERYRAAAGVS